MATRTIAFRLNDKNREDKEIMEWLDQVVYEGEYYDSLTEAVKWAILCFARGEIRFREEMSTMELMQEFVRILPNRVRQTTNRLCRMLFKDSCNYYQCNGTATGGYVAVPAMIRCRDECVAHTICDISKANRTSEGNGGKFTG